jgi:glutamine amidotransferase
VKAPKLYIIDYGLGNLQSLSNALKTLSLEYEVGQNRERILTSKGLLLPGVGAFNQGMKNLRKLGMIDVLQKAVIEKQIPILGICLGMQLFALSSEENGTHEGLGWINGHVKMIRPDLDHPVPHVGWNNLSDIEKSMLFEKTTTACDFYFDHSFVLNLNDNSATALCHYGDRYTAAVQKENIFGVQFHPEKSHRPGLRLLRAFSQIVQKNTYQRRCLKNA